MNILSHLGELNTPLTQNAFEAGYILGYLAIPIVLITVIVITAIVGKRKRDKNTENPRTEKTIKKELKELLNSEDSKVKGTLLAWCIFTGIMIAQGIIFGGNEFINWIHAGFLLALLIMVIKGRGSRRLIIIITGILAIGLFWYSATVSWESLRTNCCNADWSNCLACVSIPDYIWENEARLARIGGLIMGTYYGITALYFGFSKRAKRHFTWGQRQAELWLELEKRDRLGQAETQTESEPETEPDSVDEDDIREQLKKLKEQNKKLADKIDKLEQSNNKKGKR